MALMIIFVSLINEMNKTNAVRMLDNRKIFYELVDYEVDEEDLSAVTLARKIGMDPSQIFKTLVLRGDKTGIFVAVIPGDSEVDLKKTARITGNKSAAMVQMKELLPLTGYVRGGCSPLGMKKNYPVYIDETCRRFDHIFISAGTRGTQIKIDPEELIIVTGAFVSNISE
jgi:Cys-tRNA(Pro)/Cys-tRNA(Cys) deacylase